MDEAAAPQEIERKFLVAGDGWRKRAKGPSRIAQGYLARGRRAIIRVRIKDGRTATLTIKSRDPGIARDEFEYRIPVGEARALELVESLCSQQKCTVLMVTHRADERAFWQARVRGAVLTLPP